jgi:hypothetical protein
MKNNIIVKQSFFVIVAVAFFSLSTSAQRYYRNNHNRNYNYYHSPRPYVSVNINRYNNHRPYYSKPYYARPYYRAPYSYVHFGPSFGFRINVLPFGYYPFYIGPNPYYYYDGVYYRPYNNGGYEVIAPPLGAEVKHLPKGAKVTVIDGQKYFELGGTFYQEEINDKNKLRYKVVGTDGVLNTDNDPEVTTENNIPPPTQPDNKITTPQNNTVPAVGARFDKLPENSKQVLISKQKYFLSPGGVYYKEVVDGDNIRYEVTGNSETE